MKAIELTKRGTDDVIAHACGECKYVATSSEAAERCCAPRKCDKCGAAVGSSYCKACTDARLASEEVASFEKATKIRNSEYTGPLYTDEVLGGDWGGNYFSDEGALRETCERRETPMPAYAWACEPQRVSLDGLEILERALEEQEAHEDAIDGVSKAALKELSDFLDGWCERNTIESWHADHSRAVVFGLATAEEPAS